MEGGSAPDPAVGNKEHIPAGMDCFVVPIPAPPESESNVPSGGPSAIILPGGDDGAKRWGKLIVLLLDFFEYANDI